MEEFDDSKLIYGEEFLKELRNFYQYELSVIVSLLHNLNQFGPQSEMDVIPFSEGYSMKELSSGIWILEFLIWDKRYKLKFEQTYEEKYYIQEIERIIP
ncbi:hypothetical protein [Pseudoneobacillus sp. C159]